MLRFRENNNGQTRSDATPPPPPASTLKPTKITEGFTRGQSTTRR